MQETNKYHFMRNINCRTGKAENNHVIKKCGEKFGNNNSNRQICRESVRSAIHSTNTKEKSAKERKSRIDLILLNQETKIKTKDERVFRQPECSSNYYMVVDKIHMHRAKR